MKISTLFFLVMAGVGTGVLTAGESEKEQQQALDKLQSAREQLREAERNYADVLKESKTWSGPRARLFGSELLPFTAWHHESPDSFLQHWSRGGLALGDHSANLFWSRSHFHSGLQMIAINPELGRYFGVDKGVLILDVPEDNIYELRPGDVLLSINGRLPRNANRALRLLRTYEPDETITLSIMRDNKQQTLTVTVPEFAASSELIFSPFREAF